MHRQFGHQAVAHGMQHRPQGQIGSVTILGPAGWKVRLGNLP
jgi:hypothetical protein